MAGAHPPESRDQSKKVNNLSYDSDSYDPDSYDPDSYDPDSYEPQVGNSISSRPGGRTAAVIMQPTQKLEHNVKDVPKMVTKLRKRSVMHKVDTSSPSCTMDQCGTQIQDHEDWRRHVWKHHYDTICIVSSTLSRCIIDECGSEFYGPTTQKRWQEHVQSRHEGYLKPAYPDYKVDGVYNQPNPPNVNHPRKRRYADGGRMDLIPRDGTFLTRLVKRMAREANIQEGEIDESVGASLGSHYTGEHESATNAGVIGQYIRAAGDQDPKEVIVIEDVAIGESETGSVNRRTEGLDRVTGEGYTKEITIADQAEQSQGTAEKKAVGQEVLMEDYTIEQHEANEGTTVDMMEM